MAIGHLMDTYRPDLDAVGPCLGPPGRGWAARCLPARMDTEMPSPPPATMTLAELADHLSVTPQALYDLRSKGRGPRGFRVGRQLRFRPAEVEAWIAGLEAADGARHRRRARP